MEHEPKIQRTISVVEPRSFFESARFHIALALPRAEEHIPAAALIDHAPRNVVVLVFIIIVRKLRPVRVLHEMRAYLIAHI